MKSKRVCDIWKSNAVVAALKKRTPDDIAVMDCPKCGVTSYYNQGSHFSCRGCHRTFYAANQDEEIYRGPVVYCEDARMLSDIVGDFMDDAP